MASIPMMADMPGMEHAEDTLGVPPLVAPRVLAQYCNAVQRYADGMGLHDPIAEQLARLRMRLENLRSVAVLCRLAVLGHPNSFARLRDELNCIAVDFPGERLELHCGCGCARCTCECSAVEADLERALGEHVSLSAVLDLLAGAAFVSKDDPGKREALVIGVVRAVLDAICHPLAYAQDSAAYLGEGSGQLAPAHATSVIANATYRMLDDDYACDPRVPLAPRRLLECLGRQWIAADPVTEWLRVLTGPQLTGMLRAIEPHSAQVGERVSLALRAPCVEEAEQQEAAFERVLDDLVVVFCPRQPAKLAGRQGDQLQVEVPPHARSGPIALVRRSDDAAFADVQALLERYACEYPRAWYLSVFSLVPLPMWRYPVAFGPPLIDVPQVPTSATVSAFTASGLLSEKNPAHVDQPVYIYFQVQPAGSEAEAPLSVTAANGTVTRPGAPGVIVYTPNATGKPSIELSWGSLSQSVAVPVEPAVAGGSGQP